MDYQVRPIVTWKGPFTSARRGSPFRASYRETLDLLENELAHLKASHLVFQIAVEEREVRLDGRLRVDARPTHPGVIVSFQSKFGPLSYPCDTFLDWRDNLRAIALAMEALRKIDRYGVTRRGEQYTGWKALPGPDYSKAVRFFEEHSGVKPIDADSLDRAYKIAARRLHPDVGGSNEAFVELGTMRQILTSHLKGANQ